MLEERVRDRELRRGAHEQVELELELAADAADIFEVRGWTRAERGRQLPIAMRPGPGHVPLRRPRRHPARATHVAFSEPAAEVGPVDPDVAGSANAGWVRLALALGARAGRGARAALGRWTSERPVPGRRTARRRTAEPDDVAVPARARASTTDEVAASYHAWNRSVAEIRTDNELFNLAIARSAGDLRLLVNDGPGDGERYLAAGVPWFATLFGRDCDHRLVPGARASGRSSPSRRSRCWPRSRRRTTTRTGTPSPARSSTSCGPARWPGPASCRTGRTTASVDATPLWLILLGATYDWTGDRALVDRLWPNALRALDWIDR